MEYNFFALISRMKYIDRWALMRNNREENLCEHCLEVSMIAHALATIGNVRYGKTLNAERAALIGLYHDASEIITGDMPTPVKYYNDEMKAIYKQIEKSAAEKLQNHLPPELRAAYAPYLGTAQLAPQEQALLKCADKLCAYIKCIYERNAGNMEFQHAYVGIGREIETMQAESDELQYFLAHCLPAFSLTLDDLQGTL